MKLLPLGYRVHGKTPKGDPRFQCKACKKTFSVGSPTRRHRETTETGEIFRLLVNNVPLRRIIEITGVPAARLYNRIDFLHQQCRDFAAHKDQMIAGYFAGRNRVISTDVQTLLVNWRHADRILNVPVLHCVSVERESGYVVAATTDFDPAADPLTIEQEMYRIGDFNMPRAWRRHGRLWAFGEYQDSILRGVMNNLTPQERHFASNSFDPPGTGGRVRGDIFQAAHMMLVKKRVGEDFRQLVLCLDGDTGLAKLTCALFADGVIDGRVHVADVRFSKELGNQNRNKLVAQGDGFYRADLAAYAYMMGVAKTAYGLKAEATQLVAARLLMEYGVAPSDFRAEQLAQFGYEWRYHRKEEPEKTIRLLTDRGCLSFGELAMLLSRCSMAPVDKYFAQARRRVRAFERGSRPTAGKATWYVSAFYNPEMVEKLSTILRFYHNFMLLEAPSKGVAKSERQTPGMKVGAARGLVYVRDILSFS